MSISSRQIALLRFGQRKLGWSDETWRSVLAELGGVTSTTELDREGFDLIVSFLEYSGFRPAQAKGPDYGRQPGFASFGQLELIRALWREWTRGEGTEEGLHAWFQRCWKVSHPRFLTAKDARSAIAALKAMKARAA
jgi:hypothetical protein